MTDFIAFNAKAGAIMRISPHQSMDFFGCLLLSDILWILCGQLSYTLFLTSLFFKNVNIWEKQTRSINQIDSHLSTGQCATIEYLCLCFHAHSLAPFLCPFVTLQLYHRVTMTRTSSINGALTTATSSSRRDTCLSALLSSRLVKVKSWILTRSGSGGGAG